MRDYSKSWGSWFWLLFPLLLPLLNSLLSGRIRRVTAIACSSVACIGLTLPLLCVRMWEVYHNSLYAGGGPMLLNFIVEFERVTTVL